MAAGRPRGAVLALGGVDRRRLSRGWLRARGLSAFAQHVHHELRTRTYDRIQRLTLEFFDEKQTGELMSILSSSVNDLNAFLQDSLDKIIQLVGVGVGLFWITGSSRR